MYIINCRNSRIGAGYCFNALYKITRIKTGWFTGYPVKKLVFLGQTIAHYVSKSQLKKDKTMVPILHGNSEIGANVKSNLCYLISLQRLFGSRAVTNRIFLRKNLFSFSHTQHVLSYHFIQLPWIRTVFDFIVKYK